MVARSTWLTHLAFSDTSLRSEHYPIMNIRKIFECTGSFGEIIVLNCLEILLFIYQGQSPHKPIILSADCH